MEENEQILQQLASSKWYDDKADELLKKYRECPTMTMQGRMLPQLEAMMGKLRFQQRELEPHLPNNNET